MTYFEICIEVQRSNSTYKIPEASVIEDVDNALRDAAEVGEPQPLVGWEPWEEVLDVIDADGDTHTYFAGEIATRDLCGVCRHHGIWTLADRDAGPARTCDCCTTSDYGLCPSCADQLSA